MGKDRDTSDSDDSGAGGGRGWSILQNSGWSHDLNIRTDPFHEYIAWKLFDTGFIVIRWILGCDLPMHKSGLGQNEAGVPL